MEKEWEGFAAFNRTTDDILTESVSKDRQFTKDIVDLQRRPEFFQITKIQIKKVSDDELA